MIAGIQLVCDRCGFSQTFKSTYLLEAMRLAREDGWGVKPYTLRGDTQAYCQCCAKKQEEENE